MRQPWLHELVVAVDGNATALSDRTGAMGARRGPADATGLYVDDRRVLSVLDVWLGSHPTETVVARGRGNVAAVWGCARHLGNDGADPTVEVQRTRTVRDGGMSEHVVVRSRADHVVRTTASVRLGGDGADLAAVKDGRAGGPLLPALPAAPAQPAAELGSELVCSWSDPRHVTTVAADRAPSRVVPGVGDEPSLAVFDLLVPPGGAWALRLDVETTRLAASTLDADSACARADWAAAGVEADDPRLASLLSRSLDDLAHLLLADPEVEAGWFAAAGSPWFLTLFGRDSLWTARLLLPFSLGLAEGTLRALAHRQGRVEDPQSCEEPGKILHEVRRAVRDTPGPAQGRSTYYGTVDATCLWICLLHDAWRHGLEDDAVVELLPALHAALGWLADSCGRDTDGLLRYVDRSGAGLANQGWKDSGDSMRRTDGSLAPAPIALVEAQAYAVEAARGAAAVLEQFEPTTDAAARWRELAADLAERVRTHYWTPGRHGYLAMAVDGDGRQVDGLGSNMGHVLGTGTLEPEEAARVAATLTSPDLLGRHGISTLARSNPAFNPIGYHTGSVWTHDTAICVRGLAREGHADAAARVAVALVDAGCCFDDGWPELFSGEPVLGAPAPYPASCRPQAWSAAAAPALVAALLGLEIDVPAARVRVRPAPSLPFGAMTARGLVYGPHRFSVRVDAAGAVTVAGLPHGVRIETD